VARAYAFESEHLKEIIKKAIKHKGAAFIDVLQPCVTFNDIHTVEYYKTEYITRRWRMGPSTKEKNEEAVMEKLLKAFEKSMEWNDRIPIGVFYINPYVPTFEERIVEKNPSYKTNISS